MLNSGRSGPAAGCQEVDQSSQVIHTNTCLAIASCSIVKVHTFAIARQHVVDQSGQVVHSNFTLTSKVTDYGTLLGSSEGNLVHVIGSGIEGDDNVILASILTLPVPVA